MSSAASRKVNPPYAPPCLWPGIIWEGDGDCRCPRAMHNGQYEIKIIDGLCPVHRRLKHDEQREAGTQR